MPNFTTNLNLEKPLVNENYNIEVFNANADKLDTAIKEVSSKVDNLKVPVTSVNNKTGAINLVAADIKTTDGKTLEQFKADASSQLDTFEQQQGDLADTINEMKNGELGDLKQSLVDIEGYIKCDGRKIDKNIYPELREFLFNNDESTRTTDLSFISRISGVTTELKSIAYGKGFFVVVGNVGVILVSTDGINWSSVDSGVTNSLTSVKYLNEKFFATGIGGTILTSLNGTTWTKLNSGTTNALYSLTYEKGIYVAVGNTTILTSTDGATWISRTVTDLNNTSNYLYSVIYAKGMFVGVGTSGLVFSSSDGLSWVKRVSNVSGNIGDVTYGNGKFIITTTSSEIATSEDGITWTKQKGLPVRAEFINYQDGLFIAGGYNGQVAISRDGESWDIVSTTVSSILNDSFYYNDIHIIVGREGLIETAISSVATPIIENTYIKY